MLTNIRLISVKEYHQMAETGILHSEPGFLTSGASLLPKPLSSLDFERFRHCMNRSSM